MRRKSLESRASRGCAGITAAALSCLIVATGSSGAQTITCQTNNCSAGFPGGAVPPPDCMTRVGSQLVASPRIFEVEMNSSPNPTCTTPLHRFLPSSIRVEGGSLVQGAYQCIVWHKTGACTVPWHSATENTFLNTCNTSTLCSATNVTPDPCAFETGNINTTGTPGPWEYGTCHYRDVASGTYPFECRLHAGAGMTGQLRVVTPLDLRLAPGAGGSVTLTWATGGSPTGPWEAFRHPLASMPADASLVNLTPAGVTVRTLADTPPAGSFFAYMIRERN